MTQPLSGDGQRILVQPPTLLPSGQGVEESGELSPTREPRKLGTLLDVSQALAGHLHLQAGLSAVLLILGRRCGVVQGSVALLDQETGELEVRATLKSSQKRSTRSPVSQRISAEVMATGEPLVIPRISQDGRFLRRESARGAPKASELSLLCVPLLLHRRSVGTLEVELPYRSERILDHLLKFLRIVAALISQAVRIHRLLEAERQRLVNENAQLRQELHGGHHFSSLVGSSGPMRQLYNEVARVAATNTTVLIQGESGTGKELIAQAIHRHSPRAKKPFITVNCAALPETLVESELFGHERGAFTGAQQRKKGRFELANGGTIFLDEVGELSPGMQVKLLRVLQEREFERVGGTEPVRVDVRVIAATNRDLEKALSESTFRDDLYYRLNVFPIFIPPLRTRKADVLPLADHFIERYAREHGKSIKRIATSAIDLLATYHWPGNVRELENTIERAVLLADGEVIHSHHLPPTLQTAGASGTVVRTSLGGAVEAFERRLIEDALKTTHGNRSRAARLLSTTERVISYKVKKYGIDPSRLRS